MTAYNTVGAPLRNAMRRQPLLLCADHPLRSRGPREVGSQTIADHGGVAQSRVHVMVR